MHLQHHRRRQRNKVKTKLQYTSNDPKQQRQFDVSLAGES